MMFRLTADMTFEANTEDEAREIVSEWAEYGVEIRGDGHAAFDVVVPRIKLTPWLRRGEVRNYGLRWWEMPDDEIENNGALG